MGVFTSPGVCEKRLHEMKQVERSVDIGGRKLCGLRGKDLINEAVINEVSNIIWNCFGLASLSSITGLKNSGHLFNQSDARPKPLAND